MARIGSPDRVKFLFVKLKHIGDALLLTPTLAAARRRYPDAAIWVVVRQGTEGILAGCPQIDQVRTSAAPETHKRSAFGWWADLRLIAELRRQHFDHAFELTHGDRGRVLVWLSGARMRVANKTVIPLSRFWRGRFDRLAAVDWAHLHRAEADYRIVADGLDLGSGEPPPLVFDRSCVQPCESVLRSARFAVLHPGTRWQQKRWPEEKWIELGRRLLTRVERIVVSIGPDEAEVRLGAAIAGSLGDRAITTQGRLSWAQLAGLLYDAVLFVGVDTAAMHLAAACQCPGVGVFGPSDETAWRPWQSAHRIVAAPHPKIAERQTRDVTVDAVFRACTELLADGQL